MKDATHHRLHVQRKVIQSLRKEMEKEEARSLKDGEGLNRPLALGLKKSTAGSRMLRVPS
jgi:hypothetical protein